VSTRKPRDFEFETEDEVIARCETIRNLKIEDKEIYFGSISQITDKNLRIYTREVTRKLEMMEGNL
jgi:hypothetical protein